MTGAVAVLGAGIMGASTALHLARNGRRSVLFDQAPAPFTGASRWNEGKIHLGFLYAADPTLDTARAVLPSGLDFRDQVERLTGFRAESVATSTDDHYLVHRDSVVRPEQVDAYVTAVAGLVRQHPDAHRYLVDVTDCPVRRLSPAELDELATAGLAVAGWQVPERSVNTSVLADAYIAALEASPRIDLLLGQRVTSVEPAGDGQWRVHTTQGRHGPFAAVVNALWEGRPEIDATVDHHPDVDPHHRFRMSLFVRTDRPVSTPNAVLSVGPFGDVKNLDGHHFYLSWYPAGLLANAETVVAPTPPRLSPDERGRLADTVFDALTERLPWVAEIRRAATDVQVQGGWVYAQGQGRLDDRAAGVHRRNRLGITSVGTYHSVDTGKYSAAPTLAESVARLVCSAR